MADDSKLQDDVLAALEASGKIDAQTISVTAHDGVVTLAGLVLDPAQKLLAEEQALGVAGVKALVESIAVRSAIDPGLADDEIARRVSDLFRWSVKVPHDLAIEVEAGWVTLSGMVDFPAQREQANRLAASVNGALGVINTIAVRNRPSAAQVKRQITSALIRQAESDASGITIAMEEGHVVVTGKVAGWMERSIAGNVALAASGASYLRNDILVRLPPSCSQEQSSFVAVGC